MANFMITMTLRPKMYVLDATEQYDATIGLLDGVLPERATVVCELTKSANVHYHALVYSPASLTRTNKRIQDMVRADKRLGFLMVTAITDIEGAKTYVSKTLDECRQLINRPSLIRDDFDYFPNILSPIKATW